MTARMLRLAPLFLAGLLAAPAPAATAPDENAAALERPLPQLELNGDEAPLDEASFDTPAPPPPPIDLDYRPPGSDVGAP